MEMADDNPAQRAAGGGLLNTLAVSISVVLHPLFLPLYFMAGSNLGYFSSLGASVRSHAYFLSMATLFCAIPVLGICMLKLGGAVSDWHLTSKRDRLLVMAMVTGVLLAGLYRMQNLLSLNYIIHVVITAQAFCCLLCFLVNLFYRLSAHSIGMAGVAALLISLANKTGGESLLGPFIISILALGVVVWARLNLAAHSPAECIWAIAAGGLVGWFAPELVTLAGG